MEDGQKKILLLRGIAHMVDVVKTAQNMGYHVIVTDRDAGSPAKKAADKSYEISTADIDQLVEIAKAEGIDGVFNGFDDINTWNALALCERLGIPYYATYEQLEICSNKDRFKNHCRKYDVPVVEEYNLENGLTKDLIASLRFPVIVKPVDSYASQGITVCYGPEDVKAGYAKALDYSKSETAIIEPFIDTSYGLMMYYTVFNGDVILSAVTDRHVHKHFEEHPPLPIAVMFPSRHREQYLAEVDPQVRAMLRGMGIQNGVLLIQALYDNGRFYLYEMGFRISGSQHYNIIEKQTGVNLLEMMLDLSVGKDISKYDTRHFDDSYIPHPACNLPILMHSGTIAEIRGMEEILAMPEILTAVVNRKAGDTVAPSGSYAQMFGRFTIVADSSTELNRAIDFIYDQLRIISTEGEDMLLVRFHPEEASTV